MDELDPEPMHVDGLGSGWESTEAAMAAVQADLFRTIPDAPSLRLVWLADPGTEKRRAYVGKGLDWYYGAGGGFELTDDYAEMVVAIAGEVSDAVVDNLLGYHSYWPPCPSDAKQLHVDVEPDGRCVWACHQGARHIVAEVGALGLTRL